MDSVEREQMLSQIEVKVGIIKAFYQENDVGAKELIEMYEEYRKEGTSFTEIQLFLDDLILFIETMKSV